MSKKIIPLLAFSAVFALIGSGASADWTEGMNAAQSTSQLPDTPIYEIVRALLQWILAIFTLLCAIAFVITGIMFLLAGSNADLATKAKTGVGYSIIGIVIGLSGYIIIRFIDELLGGRLWV